jgi:hypothetical protein
VCGYEVLIKMILFNCGGSTKKEPGGGPAKEVL